MHCCPLCPGHLALERLINPFVQPNGLTPIQAPWAQNANPAQAVMPTSSLVQRSNDALITGKVKASFVDAQDISLNAFKVVTERNTVFLMGRVTPREVARVTEIARGVGGVEKVVRVFEIVSEDELARYKPAPVTTDSSPKK